MFENINYWVLNICILLMTGFVGLFIFNISLGISEFFNKHHYKYISNIKHLIDELQTEIQPKIKKEEDNEEDKS